MPPDEDLEAFWRRIEDQYRAHKEREDLADEELLREASDPRTTGERLRGVWAEATIRARRGPADCVAGQALDRVMQNPSIPLDLLAAWLREYRLEAWYHPAVPLLLRGEPSPDYEEVAFLLLENLECRHEQELGSRSGRTLAEHLMVRAQIPAGNESERPVRACVRHLAGLFGLPWPSEKE